MGMYTGFKVDVWLDPNIPIEVFRVLGWMVSHDSVEPPPLPEHDLFWPSCRWRSMLTMQSTYFPACQDSPTLRGYEKAYRLQVNSSFKNYKQEAQLFINWLYPHIITGRIAHRYEENDVWTTVDFQPPPNWESGDPQAPRVARNPGQQAQQDLVSGVIYPDLN